MCGALCLCVGQSLCYVMYGMVMLACSNSNNSHECADEAYARILKVTLQLSVCFLVNELHVICSS